MLKRQNNGSPGWLWAILGCTTYFILLTAAFTWPQVKTLDTAVPGSGGDRYFVAWMVGWFRRALTELHVSPYYSPFVNYPVGFDMAYCSLAPMQVLLALPAALLANDVVGYNVAYMASYVISGLTMTAWVAWHTRRLDVGLVAGTAFALTPYRNAHAVAGHLDLLGTQWLPLYFLGLDMLLAKRGGWKAWVLAGGAYGLTALSAQYYMYMTLVMTLPYLAVGIYRHGMASMWANRKSWLLAAAIGLLLLVLAEAPYVRLVLEQRDDDHLFKREIASIARYGANPYDLLVPPNDHFLWPSSGRASTAGSVITETTIYLGILPLLTLPAALLVRRRDHRALPQIPMLLTAAGVAAILVLGPYLSWRSELVMWNAPAQLEPWLGTEPFRIRLPGYYLSSTLPFYSSLRVPSRYGLYVSLYLCAALGLTLAHLLRGSARATWRVLGTSLAVLIIVVDVYPGPKRMGSMLPYPVHEYLAELPDDGALLNLPLVRNKYGDGVYYAALADKPFVGSFGGAYLTPHYLRIKPWIMDLPSAENLNKIVDLGVRHIVIWKANEGQYEQITPALQSLGLTKPFEDQDHMLLEIDPGVLVQAQEEEMPIVEIEYPPMAWAAAMVAKVGGWTNQDSYPRQLCDVTGDGLADLVGFGRNHVFVAVSTGKSFDGPLQWSDDFAQSAWPTQDLMPRTVADVDGNGLGDLIGFGDRGVQVALAADSVFSPASLWLADSFGPAQGWLNQDRHPRFVADVDGDGRADLIGVQESGVDVALSTGNSFGQPAHWLDGMSPRQRWISMDRHPRSMADVDGDGLADLCGFGDDGIWVAFSTGKAFRDPLLWSTSFLATERGWSSQDTYPRIISDVDGDGRADVTGFGEAGVYVALGNANGLGPVDVAPRRYNKANVGWASQNLTPRLIADVDGDGRGDIVALGNSAIYVSPWQKSTD